MLPILLIVSLCVITKGTSHQPHPPPKRQGSKPNPRNKTMSDNSEKPVYAIMRFRNVAEYLQWYQNPNTLAHLPPASISKPIIANNTDFYKLLYHLNQPKSKANAAENTSKQTAGDRMNALKAQLGSLEDASTTPDKKNASRPLSPLYGWSPSGSESGRTSESEDDDPDISTIHNRRLDSKWPAATTPSLTTSKPGTSTQLRPPGFRMPQSASRRAKQILKGRGQSSLSAPIMSHNTTWN